MTLCDCYAPQVFGADPLGGHLLGGTGQSTLPHLLNTWPPALCPSGEYQDLARAIYLVYVYLPYSTVDKYSLSGRQIWVHQVNTPFLVP